MTKPSIPKGTRDFSPAEMARREMIFDTVKKVFRLYGYQQIETPAMENLSTLLGKYGEEGDKLLFRILNSGDFLSGTTPEMLKPGDYNKLSSSISEKGLRYDLTVPFARYVVQHRDEISFPFKRFQIQPVWRADRPQKGRYREFFQCDVDVIGSDSLLNEYELLLIIDEVFARLGINVIIKVNNRKILSGIAEYIGEPDKITDITMAIDKMEKIGPDDVNSELVSRGVSVDAVTLLQPLLQLKGDFTEKINGLKKVLAGSSTGLNGIQEVATLFDLIGSGEFRAKTELDITLARGLNYYTGAIIEVKAADMQIGSICGGGRYDNLTGIFGLPGVSGVGVSFGADRIYDVMSHLELFSDSYNSNAGVLIINFGDPELPYALKITELLRKSGISAELFPDQARLKKQFGYADMKKIPVVVMAGGDEIKADTVTVKNMLTGSQEKVPFHQMVDTVMSVLNAK